MEREGEVTRSLFPRKSITRKDEGCRKEGERKVTRSLLPRAHFVRELEECAKGRRNITCSLSLAFPSRENVNDAKMKEEERLRVPISLVCLHHKVFSLL